MNSFIHFVDFIDERNSVIEKKSHSKKNTNLIQLKWHQPSHTTQASWKLFSTTFPIAHSPHWRKNTYFMWSLSFKL